MGSTTLARSPRKSLGQVRYPMGRSVTPPARRAHTHGGVARLLQLLEQGQTPLSLGGTNSLASQYQHSKCSQPCRDISSPQQNSLSPKLLSYARAAKSNTWNYCPGKDQRKTIKVSLFWAISCNLCLATSVPPTTGNLLCLNATLMGFILFLKRSCTWEATACQGRRAHGSGCRGRMKSSIRNQLPQTGGVLLRWAER